VLDESPILLSLSSSSSLLSSSLLTEPIGNLLFEIKIKLFEVKATDRLVCMYASIHDNEDRRYASINDIEDRG